MPNPQISDDDAPFGNSRPHRRTNQPPLLDFFVKDIRRQSLDGLSDATISAVMGSDPPLRDTIGRATVIEEEVHRIGEGEVEMVVEIEIGMDILTKGPIHGLPKRSTWMLPGDLQHWC